MSQCLHKRGHTAGHCFWHASPLADESSTAEKPSPMNVYLTKMSYLFGMVYSQIYVCLNLERSSEWIIPVTLSYTMSLEQEIDHGMLIRSFRIVLLPSGLINSFELEMPTAHG